MLQAQDFAGNVRELRNLLERTALLCDGDTLGVRHLERALQFNARPPVSKGPSHYRQQTPAGAQGEDKPGTSKLKSAEHAAFAKLVESHTGNRTELARHLGISVRSLYRKLKLLAQ